MDNLHDMENYTKTIKQLAIATTYMYVNRLSRVCPIAIQGFLSVKLRDYCNILLKLT